MFCAEEFDDEQENVIVKIRDIAGKAHGESAIDAANYSAARTQKTSLRKGTGSMRIKSARLQT